MMHGLDLSKARSSFVGISLEVLTADRFEVGLLPRSGWTVEAPGRGRHSSSTIHAVWSNVIQHANLLIWQGAA